MGKEEVLAVTKAVNAVLGKPVLALLALLHIHPENAQYPIPNYIAMEFLVFLIAAIFFLWLKPRIRADRPGATQQIMEFLLVNPMGVGIKDLIDDIVGHDSDRHIPMMGTIALFIFLSNMLAIVPGLMSPTAAVTVPLGCAVVAFIYYNAHGIKKQGPLKFLLHFAGPVWWMASLILPIEIVSHLARVLSLTIRLFANMFAGDMVTLVFFSLVPLGVPILFLGLHIGVSFLQTYIFILLTTVYLAGAVAEDH